ncbi:uncharacterized protein LOC134702075 [Mytilus trossulus]|uniref:uncharacterized protein LOC134702075 n=1 Tax=Mytilus trossulus TaxID=6551 RepID=UPI0030050D6B
MYDFKKIVTLIRTFFFVFVVGFTFHVLGFGTPYWSVDKYSSKGLWNNCYTFICLSNCSDLAWFEATQALETLGLFAAFLALVFLVLFIFHPQSSSNKAIFIIGMVSTFVAAGFTVLGIVIYGAKNRDLSWSYGLTVIAGAMYTGSGILMVLHLNLNLQQT